MSRKKDMIPFSPLYEPLIRDRYRDKYVVGFDAVFLFAIALSTQYTMALSI